MKATDSTPKTSAKTKSDDKANKPQASGTKSTKTTTKKTRATASTSAATSSPSDYGSLSKAKQKEMVSLWRKMLTVRTFELRAGQAYTQAKIGGYCHLNLGEEATVVGLTSALKDQDYLYGGYRFHGYALERDLGADAIMAELFGKTTGTSKGWGGSMHLFDASKRVMGGYGIVGGQIPLATGAAFGIDYRDEKGGPDGEAVLCLLGDGTTNIGAFHESLNIASLWNLPIVFVVVNNQLGMGTTVENSSAEPELYKRAAAYKMEGVRVDGNDVLAVREAAEKALKTAREKRRPVLLETMSFRLKGHSVVDPARYRSKEEVDHVKEMDPVPKLRDALIKAGVFTDDDADEIERQVDAEIDAAVEFADESPDPEVSVLFDGVYATSVANEARQLPGDPVLADGTNE